MKRLNLFKTLVLALSFISVSAYSRPIACPQYVAGDKKLELVQPEAGLEYPTETPAHPSLANYNVLKIGAGVRILVGNELKLQCGVLSDNAFLFLTIKVEPAVAGIDFPTDGPADLERDFLVWVLDNGLRVSLNRIAAITHAVAGIDFPTDGPAELDRDFYVMMLRDGSRIRL